MSIAGYPNEADRQGSNSANLYPMWGDFNSEEGAENVAYECRALLCPEPGGGFSAHCLNLLGVVSEGETEDEAIKNIADAFRETLLYYRESGEVIPRGAVEIDRVSDSKEKWILVRL